MFPVAVQRPLSVPCMFSGMGREGYDAVKASHQDNILDVLQRAGVEVIWLDNDSGCKGVCERVMNKDITAANDPQYCKDGECLDNILLSHIDDVIQKHIKIQCWFYILLAATDRPIMSVIRTVSPFYPDLRYQ